MSNVLIGLVVVAGIIILQSAISVHGQDPRCKLVGQTVYDDCGQRCLCSSKKKLVRCTRIRKEFTNMETSDRIQYIKTIKETSKRYKSEYEELLNIHRKYFDEKKFKIHQKDFFLPWHRWFLLQYENLMRKVDCKFTVAYWDWASKSGDPWNTTEKSLWYNGESGFGGNGSLPYMDVETGPFKKWKLRDEANFEFLKRKFNQASAPPNLITLAALLKHPASEFHCFELNLRLILHNNVHCLVNGTMCTLDSAEAPEFFLHHGFIDKIWEDWQKKSCERRHVFFPCLKEAMPGTDGMLPGSFLHSSNLPGDVRVEYEENKKTEKVESTLAKLPWKKLLVAPLIVEPILSVLDEARKLFKTDEKEAAHMKKYCEKLLRNRKVAGSEQISDEKKKPLTDMDRELGFELKKVSEMARKAKSKPKTSREEGKSRPEETSDEKLVPLTDIDKELGFEHKKVFKIARKAKSKPKPSQDEKPSCSEMVKLRLNQC